MTNSEIATKFHEAQIRIADIVWLAGSTEGFANSDFFEEVIMEAAEGEGRFHKSMNVFAGIPEWVQDEDGFIDWMLQTKTYGFVVCVHTPRPTHFCDDGGWHSNGFGWVMTTHIYVENIIDVVPLAIEWADRLIGNLREKSKAAEVTK